MNPLFISVKHEGILGKTDLERFTKLQCHSLIQNIHRVKFLTTQACLSDL